MTSDDDILQIFLDADDPFLGTSEVASELDYSLQGTGKRLDELVDKGDLNRKVVGNTAIYWHPSRTDDPD